MIKYKRLIIAFVCMLVISGCTGIPSTPAASIGAIQPQPSAVGEGGYSDPELERAVELGIGEWREDDPQVTYAEFFAMLDNAVKLSDDSKSGAWKQRFPEARESSQVMDRYNGMLMVFYAAETLGEQYYDFNSEYIFHLNEQIGDKWGEVIANESLFPKVMYNAKFPGFDNNYHVCAYFYSMGRLSFVSGKRIFDYDPEQNSMRTDEPLIYTEALLAALRLHDSMQPEIKKRTVSEADTVLLNAADTRRDAILNSPTTVQVKGKKYYVSNSGNDNNDGLTPQTAWATLGKVNSACTRSWNRGDYRWNNDHFPEFIWASKHRNKRITLKPGDGVFFERGGLWRGMLRTVSGVTYSAYGEGEKPRIYGSPENGSGAEKWSLLEGTNNIWVFYKDLQDCGGILLGDDTVAVKQPALLYKDKYYYVGDEQWPNISSIEDVQPFDVKTLGDLRFFNDIHYSHGDNEYLDYGEHGKLYLRCDGGNPGSVYASIEFFTGNNDWNDGIIKAESNCVIDNICARFGAAGITTQGSDTHNATIQNCEVGWLGGMIGGYGGAGLGTDNPFAVVRCGDGIMLGGKGNRAINNYIYQTFDWALTVEAYLEGTEKPDEYKAMLREDCAIEGNLVERCSGGALIVGWYAYNQNVDAPLFRNIAVKDNFFMDCGNGGWAHLEDKGFSYLADIGVFLNPGCEKIDISNNVLYATRPENSLVGFGCHNDDRDTIRFNGNIYAQNDYGYMVNHEARGEDWASQHYGFNMSAEQTVTEILGDSTGLVFPLNGMPFSFDIQKLKNAVDAIVASAGI